MIAEALRHEIEAHVLRTDRNNPLLAAARQGVAEPEAVGRYLSSLLFIISKTPECLTRAEQNARDAGEHRLAEYFRVKFAEEVGHDAWAEADLSAFEATFRVVPGGPVPAMTGWFQQLLHMIETDPAHYAAYIVWAEYFAVIAGGELVRALVERCGVPIEVLSCLANHVELDEDHTEENFDCIDDVVTDPAKLPAMRESLRVVMGWFDRACEEMVAGVEHREAV